MNKITIGNNEIIEGTSLPYSGSLQVNSTSGSIYINHDASEISSSIDLYTMIAIDNFFPGQPKNTWVEHSKPEYGEIYCVGNTTLETLTENIWAEDTNNTWSEASHSTANVSASANTITILPKGEGWYRIYYNGCMYNTNSGDARYEVGISVNNGTPEPKTHKRHTHFDFDAYCSFQGSTTLRLNGNDNIRLVFRCTETGDPDLALYSCRITIRKMVNYNTAGF
jgi:hypothetical protein